MRDDFMKSISIEKQIGLRITRLRKNAGIKQKELARQMNVSVSTISHYESGTNVPNVSILIAMAEYFGVSVDYLLGQTELNLDWNTFRREIKLFDGTLVSLESVVNAFIELSDQSQSEVYRLINLFRMDDRMRHSQIMEGASAEIDREVVDKTISEWLESD